MGTCSSKDDDDAAVTPTVRIAKDVVIREGDVVSTPKDSIKGILIKDGPNKLRTLSRVSWRDIGALAGAALPEGLDSDESTGVQSRLAALGPPDPAEVAAALQLLKGSASGSTALVDATGPDTTARAADVVLGMLSMGASALSQRAATARLELEALNPEDLAAEVASDMAGKLESVAAAAAEAGKLREALSLCLHAHTLQADALGPDSPQAAHCLVRVAHVLEMLGRLPIAELMAKHAAHLTAKGFGLEHRAPAESLMLCGEILGLQGRFEEARAHLSCALELYVTAVGRQSAETADIYMRLGELHRNRLLYDEAARLFRQAMNTRKRVLGPRAPDTVAAIEALAGVMLDNKQYAQAEQMYLQLLQLHADMHGGAGGNSPGTVSALSRLAAVQAADEREWEAEGTLKRALAAAGKLYGTEHPVTQGLNLDLARLLIRRKDVNEVHLRAAEQLLRASLRPTRLGGVGGKAPPPSSMQPHHHMSNGGEDTATISADAQSLLAELVTRRGRHEEAERLLTQALEAYLRLHGPEHAVSIRCMCSLASAMAQRGRTSQGEPLARRAVAAATALHGEAHPLVASCLVVLGENLMSKSDQFDAHNVFRSAHRILVAVSGPEDEETLRVGRLLEKLELEAGWTQS